MDKSVWLLKLETTLVQIRWGKNGKDVKSKEILITGSCAVCVNYLSKECEDEHEIFEHLLRFCPDLPDTVVLETDDQFNQEDYVKPKWKRVASNKIVSLMENYPKEVFSFHGNVLFTKYNSIKDLMSEVILYILQVKYNLD